MSIELTPRSSGSPILLKIVSENRFSGKTYFIQLVPRISRGKTRSTWFLAERWYSTWAHDDMARAAEALKEGVVAEADTFRLGDSTLKGCKDYYIEYRMSYQVSDLGLVDFDLEFGCSTHLAQLLSQFCQFTISPSRISSQWKNQNQSQHNTTQHNPSTRSTL